MKSSIGQLEDFERSFIWQDILEELDKWLEDVHSMLENHKIKLDHRALDRLGGNAEAFHKFEDILDYMIDNTKAEQEERELKRETENG